MLRKSIYHVSNPVEIYAEMRQKDGPNSQKEHSTLQQGKTKVAEE